MIISFIMYENHITHQVSQVTIVVISWQFMDVRKNFAAIIFAFRLDSAEMLK